MTKEQNELLAKVWAVFTEYETDLDHDIEGCDGNELNAIEVQLQACRSLRMRILAHINGADARGVFPKEGE